MRYRREVLVVIFCIAATAISAVADDIKSGRSGQEVFEAHCANCHTGGFGGFFTGAPKVGDQDDWEALAPKGVAALTAGTLAGIGKMAPRGECATCTDEEIRVAVEYMLENSE
jgi:cytochrome c5